MFYKFCFSSRFDQKFTFTVIFVVFEVTGISKFSSAKIKLFLSITYLIFFSCMYSFITGFKFLRSSTLAFDLCLATLSKRLFLSFRNFIAFFLRSVTFFLYSSSEINFFCSIIFFSSDWRFFSALLSWLKPFSNLLLRSFWAFLPAVLSFKINLKSR